MTEQPKKRFNPFDRPLVVESEPEIKEKEIEKPLYEEIEYEEPVKPVQTYNYQPQYQQTAPRQTRKQPKQQYIQPVEAAKDKYTATMEVSLRRKIKIYCATNGKMFSEFIEDACREKLLREGIK
ncbi:MAG: hypothetical protein IKJ72_01340 [Mycoplasmataceae bacterium]|nr:hypothetical protein [Mycoplasmataceae bacterium]